MPSWMTAEQTWQWQISLEVKLRRVHGDSFQQFFSDVMELAHGDDFVRTRPHGSLGDKGCDGYLRSSGELFQCYGKLHDAALNVATVTGKMADDYAKAAAALSSLVQGWNFVHNLVDGLPVEVTLKLKELEVAYGHHRFGLVGPAGIAERVFGLPEREVIRLLGPTASAEDTKHMRLEEVAGVISAVIAGVDAELQPNTPPKPVPYNKMTLNSIPATWRTLLVSGSANAAYVQDYLNAHPDPETGSRLARIFRHRYHDLKAQRLPAGAIMTSLYEGITGIGSVSPVRQVAAHALLAYLFEACDIFEDHSAGEEA